MKKIVLSAKRLAGLDSNTLVWVAEEIDKLAGYKTKLERVEFNSQTFYYTFYVSRYTKLGVSSKRKQSKKRVTKKVRKNN